MSYFPDLTNMASDRSGWELARVPVIRGDALLVQMSDPNQSEADEYYILPLDQGVKGASPVSREEFLRRLGEAGT